MEIRSSHPGPQRLTASSEQGSTRLQAGQQIEARVLEQVAGAKPGQSVRVQTPAGILELQGARQFQTGQMLQLKVIATEPRLELELIRQQPNTTPGQRSTQFEEALRQFVPRQQGLQIMTAQLAAGLEQKSLPTEIRTSVQQILAAIPRAGELQNSARLADAIRDSGLFLESTLAAGRRIPQGDLKLLWLSLLAQVRTASGQPGKAPPQALSEPLKETPLPFLLGPLALPRVRAGRAGLKIDAVDQLILRLFGMAEASVARIGLNQLATAETQQQGEPRWKLEIPLAFPNDEFGVMQLQVEREKPDSESESDRPGQGHTWSLSLALDMPGLGPVHARLRLRGQTLETWILAEEADTAKRLNHHLPRLRDRLTEQGLEIERLDCREGQPDPGPPDHRPNMLNIKV